jgi:hypothetical protein
LTRELPAFIHFLEQWDIPNHLKSPRFGISHYHHPELVNALESLSPEHRLLDLIDLTLFQASSQSVWTGSAQELGIVLTASAPAAVTRRVNCSLGQVRWEITSVVWPESFPTASSTTAPASTVLGLSTLRPIPRHNPIATSCNLSNAYHPLRHRMAERVILFRP